MLLRLSKLRPLISKQPPQVLSLVSSDEEDTKTTAAAATTNGYHQVPVRCQKLSPSQAPRRRAAILELLDKKRKLAAVAAAAEKINSGNYKVNLIR